jgi:hypothetical protein
VKLLNMEELPKYPPNSKRLARPRIYYPLSDNESSSEDEATSDVPSNPPQSSRPVFRGERGPAGTVQKPVLVSEQRMAADFDYIGDLPSSGESEPEPEYSSHTRMNYSADTQNSESDSDNGDQSKGNQRENERGISQRGRGTRKRGGITANLKR